MTLSPHPIVPWTADEVAKTLRAYGLGEPIDIQAEDGWDCGRARCRVRTASGEWFVKKHHPAVVRREAHAVVAAFRARGGLAPEVMALPDGATWYDAPGGDVVEVQRLVPGMAPGVASDEVALAAMAQVAILHGLSVDLVPRGLRGWYDLAEYVAVGTKVVERFRAVGLPTDEIAALVAEEAAGIPWAGDDALIHGDLWRCNWVADEGRIAALTDFDYVHRSGRLDDVCDVILAFCSERDTAYGALPFIAPPAVVAGPRAAAMLAAYERARGPLSPQERAALPAVLRSQWFRHRIGVLDDARDEREFHEFRAAAERLLMARRVVEGICAAIR